MPNSIVSSFLQSASGGPFSATNELTGAACLTSLNIKDIEIDSSSANTSNPASSIQFSESSTYVSLTQADLNALKIIQPTRMRITGFCATVSEVNAVLSLFTNTQVTVSVTTKGIQATGMAVVDVEVEQSAAMTTAMKVTINLEQVNPSSSIGNFNPAQSADSSSFGISIQTPPSATTTITNLYNTVSNYAEGL